MVSESKPKKNISKPKTTYKIIRKYIGKQSLEDSMMKIVARGIKGI